MAAGTRLIVTSYVQFGLWVKLDVVRFFFILYRVLSKDVNKCL